MSMSGCRGQGRVRVSMDYARIYLASSLSPAPVVAVQCFLALSSPFTPCCSLDFE